MIRLMKKILAVSPLKISTLVILFLLAAFLFDPAFLRFIELKTYDLRMLYRGERAIGGETCVVAIDEKSLSELGRWPWSRGLMAELVDKLREGGARVIGFDIIFSEPEDGRGMKVIDELGGHLRETGASSLAFEKLLAQKREELDTDARLAEAVKKAGNVTLGYIFYFEPSEVAHLKEEEISLAKESISSGQYGVVQFQRPPQPGAVYEALAPLANLPEISARAENGGFFNAIPDSDGTIRWTPLVIKFQEEYYSSLAVSILMQYLEWPDTRLSLDSYGVSGIRLGDTLIPTDHKGRMLINYLGTDEAIPHYSAVDVIKGRVPPGALKDRIVIVGATAIGIYDLRVTPYSPVTAGVNIHATVVDNILRQSFIFRSFTTSLLDVLSIIALGFLAGILVPRLRAVAAILTTILLMAGFITMNFLVFSRLSVWLNLVYPLAAILLSYMGITVHKFLSEEKERKKIRNAFQFYLTSSVINEMLKYPEKLQLGGQKKELSVLFSDIRGFTSISEGMSPEDLVKLLNEYLTAMTDIVFKYDGLLDKYMGDAIMAVYGAPLEQRDHAMRACRTALEMLARLDQLREKLRQEGRPDIDIGVGINSGEMVVGNMGSQMRFDYTVMGDRVNLGSRLEGINKIYGTRIIVSEDTRNIVADQLVLRELDAVRVKGKDIPVRIYELRGEQGEMTEGDRGFIARFEEGLTLYRECRWDDAARSFREALGIIPDDGPAKIYLERIEKLKDHPPPPGWDGVFAMETK